ncbi:MAG: diguanylate cyclase [Deltaproteobacteria bacterium]|nr:diguanylate cyclase [Deltaproteobacteria bacterium]
MASLRSIPGLSAGDRAELQALEREGDESLFWEGLLRFGMRLEAGHREGVAVEIYAASVGAVRERPLQRRFQAQLDAILGRGASGLRAEFLLRRFAAEASDPAALLALGAAGAAYRMTRLAALSRLVAAPASVWTRGFGARAAASLAGFAVEAPVFTFSGRIAGAALGRPQQWGAEALGRDVASSYLVLGGLKLAGWASRAGGRIPTSLGPVAFGGAPGSPLQMLFQQGGMLTGILLGHSLEQYAGLRPRLDGATTLVDSLALLVQFHVAGNLARRAFGPRWAAWERGLERQAEVLARTPRPGGGLAWPGLAGPRPALETGPRLALDDPRLGIAQMTAEGPGGGSSRRGRAPQSGSRAVALSPVLRRAMRLQDTKALAEVLRLIYARVHGPLRGELLNVLVALEAGQPVQRRILSMLKDGRVYRTQFLSPEVQQFVADRIHEHEQESDLFPPESAVPGAGPRRPNVRGFERMVRELGMPPQDVARILNRLFAPHLDLSRFPGARGEAIYISNPDDEANLADYAKYGRESLGELLFFSRKRLSRNWMLHEAAKRLGMRPYILQQIERNQRRPSPRQLERLAGLYDLDIEQLRALRSLPPAASSATSAAAAVPSPAPQPVLPSMSLEAAPESLRPSAETQLQLRTDRLRQLQSLEATGIPPEELFREALELADYFEGIVRETRNRAERDLLTGLRNRQGLARITPRLERRLAEQRRNPEAEAKSDFVAMIDIDFFKSVNDRFGHPNGDRVLREVGQTLAQTVRWRKDITARLGGEEFFAFLSASGREGALASAERIRQAVEKALIPLDDFPAIQVTVSVGLAELRALPPAAPGAKPRVEGALAEAIERADRALYEAKHAGRNRVVVSGE